MVEYYKIEDPVKSEVQLVGNGLKKCMVIIKKNDYESSIVKLEEILKAVGLDKKKDVVTCILEFSDHRAALGAIQEYGIRDIISFGGKLDNIFPNVSIPYYSTFKTESYNWLSAPPLKEVLRDQSQKMYLWKALQKMFLGK